MFAFGTYLQADELEMGLMARNIIACKGMSVGFFSPERPTAAFPPFEAHFYALSHYLLGYGAWAFAVVIAVRCALSAMTAYAVYRMVQGRFPERIALLALVAVAFHPPFIYYSAVSPLLLRPPFSVLAVVIAIWCLVRFDQKQTLKRSVVVGATLGLGSLVQSNLFVVFPFALLWMSYVVCKSTELLGTRKKALLVMVMPMVLALAVFPWMFRNWVVLGEVFVLRSGFGTQFWLANNPMAANDMFQVMRWNSPQFDVPSARTLPREVLEKVQRASEIERDRLLLREALRFIVDDPMAFVRLTMTRLRFFGLGPPREYASPLKQTARAIYGIYSLAIGVLAVGALAFRRDRVVVLFLLVVLSFSLLHGLVQSVNYYYRMDSETFCLILGIFTLVSIWQHGKARMLDA